MMPSQQGGVASMNKKDSDTMKAYHSNLIPAGVAVASALVFAGCAATPKATFDALDRNNDERVSREEFRSQVQRQAFDNLDKDDSEYISHAEWYDYETVREPEKRFREMDKNRDKKLSYKEFSDLRRKHVTLNNLFGTVDKDSDGFLTPAEIDSR